MDRSTAQLVVTEQEEMDDSKTPISVALFDADGNPVSMADILTRLDALEEQVFEPEAP